MGLDGGELRNHGSLLERFEEGLLGPNADHAVLVSGLDCRDRNNLGVFVTDPATGTTARYPMRTFLDSWSDSSCFMVQTRVPAPGGVTAWPVLITTWDTSPPLTVLLTIHSLGSFVSFQCRRLQQRVRSNGAPVCDSALIRGSLVRLGSVQRSLPSNQLGVTVPARR